MSAACGCPGDRETRGTCRAHDFNSPVTGSKKQGKRIYRQKTRKITLACCTVSATNQTNNRFFIHSTFGFSFKIIMSFTVS